MSWRCTRLGASGDWRRHIWCRQSSPCGSRGRTSSDRKPQRGPIAIVEWRVGPTRSTPATARGHAEVRHPSPITPSMNGVTFEGPGGYYIRVAHEDSEQRGSRSQSRSHQIGRKRIRPSASGPATSPAVVADASALLEHVLDRSLSSRRRWACLKACPRPTETPSASCGTMAERRFSLVPAGAT